MYLILQRSERFFKVFNRSSLLLHWQYGLSKPPSDWKRSPGRPNHTWLRATESDLRPLNIGPSYAWKKAASREHWRSIVDAATIKKSMPFSAVKDNKTQLNDILFKIRHVSLCRPKSHNAKIQRCSLSNFE